jgi:DNA-binding GntR family transcriptional regulator
LEPRPAVKAPARRRTASGNGATAGHPPLQSPVTVDAGADGPPICSLTLPQQIADHLGHLIMNGAYPSGSRLKEEKFAARYRVSRGPVREAFRLLERHGFVEIVPRHGARVRLFDPADLASLFSVRAVLVGLAARQATEQAAPGLVDLLAGQVARLRRSAETMDISPGEHAQIAGDTQHLLARFSGNRPLLRMLEDLTGRALWRMAWRDTPFDFTTRARRQQSARFWSELLRAFKAGDGDGAERAGRALLEASRDHMLKAMSAAHNSPASDVPRRLTPHQAHRRNRPVNGSALLVRAEAD